MNTDPKLGADTTAFTSAALTSAALTRAAISPSHAKRPHLCRSGLARDAWRTIAGKPAPTASRARWKTLTALLISAAALLLSVPAAALPASPAPELDKIQLPPGFAIELWAKVDNARQMALGRHSSKGGVVYVGSMRAGKVHAVRYDTHFHATSVKRIASGLQLPSGLAWRDGKLYVAAVSQILRYNDIDRRIDNPPSPTVIVNNLPENTHHGWKFIAFGPDGKLYVPVGAPCNVCRPASPHGTLLRITPDGIKWEIIARGVRNSVGFDWNPVDHSLWFTDNGRDNLGDDRPDDELNHAPRVNMNFGFPYCHGGDVADPEFGARQPCSEFTAPALKLGAHVAPLGMRFYTGNQFPADYKGDIFIAQHGSWNRSEKTGYRVVRVHMRNGQAQRQEVFAQGWLHEGKVSGRPADVLVLPDGSLLVSDDHAGVIYRITYSPPAR